MLIGPHDLSCSLGIPEQYTHPKFDEAVRTIFRIARELGAEVLHEPRVWPEYHPGYYGAFVRDPDGNKLCVCCHDPA